MMTTSAVRDIFHVDVDAFFASVELALRPELRGKPLIVGGDPQDRSVVAAASYEARRFGVRSAMPLAKALRLCPQAICVRGNFEAYTEFSRRIREVLDEFAPLVEMTSLDDFYMDYTGCRRLHGPPMEAAERMKGRVQEKVGVIISVGISQNKLVSKIASDLAKPSGILEVWRGHEEAFLRGLPVERLPGVGPATQAALAKYNLREIGDVCRLAEKDMERAFGPSGIALWQEAHGRSSAPVAPESGPPKSISRETTFSQDMAEREPIRATLYHLIERAARQLREEHLLARRVTIKLRYADFTTATAAQTLPQPADRDDVFYGAGLERLDYLLQRRMRVRLVGVALGRLSAAHERQLDLFAGADRAGKRKSDFYSGLDRLRARFGFDIARVGPDTRLPGESSAAAKKLQ